MTISAGHEESLAADAGAPVRIFVGTDRSQMIGLRVFEFSARRHSSLPVSVTPLLDLKLPVPSDPRQRQRTGFSFSRFAIPRLAGHEGRAIYVDADMLVFKDIAELWRMPFDGAKVICQEELPDHVARARKPAGAGPRARQCSVMLLDCGRLAWDPEAIIAGLETRYTYEALMQELCILDASEISEDLPVRWNSLEHFDETTCLLHYTDMQTQPWVHAGHPHGHLWANEVRRMLAEGVLARSELEAERGLGYLRPSFLTELAVVADSAALTPGQIRDLAREDKAAGFVKHAALMQEQARFRQDVKAFERKVARGEIPAPGVRRASSPNGLIGRLKRLAGRLRP